jgi:hypothetical protein
LLLSVPIIGLNKTGFIFSVKKEVTKILKDMHLKTSIDSNSKLESPTNVQPKVAILIKDHVKPKRNDVKKHDITGKYSLSKSLVVTL